MLKTVTFLLLAVLAMTGLQAAEQPSIDTAAASYVTLAREEIFDGVIEAVHQSTVAAQTSGRVTGVLFDVDDYVTRNDVLIQLRDTEQRARLTGAESGLREARARHVQVRDDFRRKQKLYKGQAISKSELERAEAALKTAAAAVDAAQAQIDEAREQLEHTIIRAPYSGIVVERLIEAGESVQPGTPMMTGLSLEKLRVSTQIPERLVETVRSWRTARVLLPDPAAVPVQVDGITVSPRADRLAHTFEVRVPLPDATPGLYPGMSIKVAVTTGEVQRLLIPAAAVVHRSEVTGVYVVREQAVIFRQVRAGRRYGGDQREVLAGLADGERVALDPVQAAIVLKDKQAGRGNE